MALGTALAAPTIAGVLAGCGDTRAPASGSSAALPRALSPEQEQLVAAIADVILPSTDTPGARDAGVSQFIDRMLADYHTADARKQFVDGLARLDARARAAHGQPFTSCTAAQQFALVDALDAQLFGASTGGPARDADHDPRGFYGVLKELTIAGYYTSEIGATKELRVNPMGNWRANVPYSQLGSSWS
jgi:gluconate 2-dehydrogenase gamma chain